MAEEIKPVRLRILLPYSSEEEFVERYGLNVARKGMFVATRSPKPAGTALAFELVLKGGGALMRGEGVVEKSQGSGGPSRTGMIVRFTQLDEASAALLERVLQWKEARTTTAPSPQAPGKAEPVTASDLGSNPWRAALGGRLALGIDLGGGGCRMAAVIDGQAQLLSVDGVGFNLPSVISVADDGVPRVVVRAPGQELRDLGTPGSEEVTFVNRWIGRAFGRHPTLPRFAVATEDGALGFSLRGKLYLPDELAAVLFTALKEAAEVQLGRVVSEAVLCVPGSYTEAQRSAVVLAAQSAGLRVLGLINTATATALAFNADSPISAPTKFLSIDWGAGGLEVAALEVKGLEVRVIATGGDPFQGGSTLDRHLAESVLSAWETRQSFTLPRAPAMMARLTREAERVKVALSEQERVTFRLPEIAIDPEGRSIALDWELDREGLEQLLQEPIDRAAAVVRELLDDWPGRTFVANEVLLLGAQNRMPALRKRLMGVLGRTSWNEIDDEGLGARGAALYGETRLGLEVGTIFEVLAAPIYFVAIASGDSRPEKLLEHNTPLPAQRQFKLPTSELPAREIGLYQGFPAASGPPPLWSLASLNHHPEAAAGEKTFQLDVDRDGRLILSMVQAEGTLEPLLLTHVSRPPPFPTGSGRNTPAEEGPPLDAADDSRVAPLPSGPSLGGLLRKLFPRKG